MTRAREFDDVMLLIQHAINDARMLNIARSLVRQRRRVCLIAYASDLDRRMLAREGIELIAVPGSAEGWLPARLLRFYRFARRALKNIRARTYWAEDVFTLPLAVRHSAASRVLYDSREIYSAMGTLSSQSLRQGFISGLERRYIRQVDECFVSGPMDADYLHDLYGGRRPRVLMNLPHYAELRRSHRIHEHFKLPATTRILIYQGGVFAGKGLLPALQTLPLLPDLALCVVGDGPYLGVLCDCAARLHVGNRLLHLPKMPYDQLLEWTAAADLGLCFIEPLSLSYELALPNKLFEYCMAGIPSIVSDLPAMRAVIREHSIGVLVQPDSSPEVLAAAIRASLQAPAYTAMQRASQAARKVYCWEAQEGSVVDLALGR